jgi:hypothetical protein
MENVELYKYSENGIKKRNPELWEKITNYIDLDISFKEKFYLYENGLTESLKCYCGNPVKFVDMKYGYREFCSVKCSTNSKIVKERRKHTSLEKWGVDNPSKCESIKEKVRQTNFDKFGAEYPLQSEYIEFIYRAIQI